MSEAAGDPFQVWRSFLKKWEEQTNALTSEAFGKEEYVKHLNLMMSAQLRMQGEVKDAMEKALTALNLPSRADLERLATQLSRLERKIDDLGDMRSTSSNSSRASAPSPPRTKQPPNKAGTG